MQCDPYVAHHFVSNELPKLLIFGCLQANSQLKGSLKGRGGITWFASDKPSTSAFLPLLVAPLPVAFSIGQPSVMDKKAAYWLFRCAAAQRLFFFCGCVCLITNHACTCLSCIVFAVTYGTSFASSIDT